MIDKTKLEAILRSHGEWLVGKTRGERADLGGANLRGADLGGAILRGADLRGADLGENLRLVISMTTILPEGEIVGWKKAKAPDGSKCLVKLMIPSDAERSNATGRKCRASKAVVLEIQDMGGNPAGIYEARSCMHPEFIYRVGDTVAPEKPFCADRWEECASGIHFFITRDEAIRF